jgi:hypothetical protein
MTKDELQVILEKHKLWLQGNKEGVRADLSYANLRYADLEGANLSVADLSFANLEGANLSIAYLGRANLSGADLEGANLSDAYLENANLSDAYLKNANLDGADLIGAYLEDAYLSGANLESVNLRGANLRGADLEDANLEDADLRGANLEDAYLEGAIMIKSERKILMKEHEDFKESVMAEHTADIVNEPKHYARWVIEPITYIMRNGFEFWRGNIIKYASRAGYKLYEGKTQVESEIIDLKKARRYIDMRINQLEGKDKL